MEDCDRRMTWQKNQRVLRRRTWLKARLTGKSLPSTLLGTAVVPLWFLTSCGSPPSQTAAPIAESQPSAPTNLSQTALSATEATAAVPKAPPQLIKTAEISVEVKSVETSIKQVASLVKAQQGDILGLDDTRPVNDQMLYTVSMQLRIPQARLEATLAELAQLGVVQSQSLRAEDVSTQLVDFSARLRNLRRSETVLLGLMERSGSVADVLKVSQELTQVRQQIEQIDAQLTNLKNQVAFSTIRLSLQAEAVSLPPQPGLFTQLGETWSTSTRSLSDFSVAMLKLLIWLLVYSPYWLAIAAIVFYLQRHRRNRRMALPSASVPEPPPTDAAS